MNETRVHGRVGNELRSPAQGDITDVASTEKKLQALDLVRDRAFGDVAGDVVSVTKPDRAGFCVEEFDYAIEDTRKQLLHVERFAELESRSVQEVQMVGG